MSTTIDASDNVLPVTTVQVVGPSGSVTDVNPLGDSASNGGRTTQQQILPSAVQNKFLNPITQSPAPKIVTSVALNDVQQTSADLSDGLNSDPQPFAIFGFAYEGNIQNYVQVELCASIFLDAIDIGHAYPLGGDLFISNWNITRLKDARFFKFNADGSPSYEINQANQDFEWIVVEAFDSGADHTVTVQFYWRAVQNTGGGATTNH